MDSILGLSRSLPAVIDGVQPLAELDSAEPSPVSPSALEPEAAFTPRLGSTPTELATEYRRWSISRSNGISAALLSLLAHTGER